MKTILNQSSLLIIFAIAMGTIGSTTAEARRDKAREHMQQGRITQGVKSGELTPEESHKLRAGQRHVDRMQHRANKDGVITDKEAAKIEHAQNVQSRRIYQEKHDAQKAPVAREPSSVEPK